jgi:allophanate hydrolase
MTRLNLSIHFLLAQYRAGTLQPAAVLEDIYAEIEKQPLRPVWISIVPREKALARLRQLDPQLPLYGIPFAVKDNIDVAGMPTTAGCPAYAYTPSASATVVSQLERAGAILIGKTNLDQFATGLVGVRSPYGACSSVFHEEYLAGGSSSGSAVAVAKGLVSFSLGTDTAGSGRVPAAFNGIHGLKPTRGVLSTAGVVPACRSLDCVSIFTRGAADAEIVLAAAQGFDPADPFSRRREPGDDACPWASVRFRFGVPESLEFFGDSEAGNLYRDMVRSLEAAGGEAVPIDYEPFRRAAGLLYSGPWVAERYAAVGAFLEDHEADAHPTVRRIILDGKNHSAADAFKSLYLLAELRRATEAQWQRMDMMLLPTTGTIYRIAEVEADPVRLNTNLGYYTNFVNLLDLAALAIPAGLRPNGLPFGVSLIGPAFSESGLLALAGRLAGAAPPAPGCVRVAVAGAHLSGQPLNWQLTARGARLEKSCRTAPDYRLYALANTTPPKPGLFRETGFHGPGIEVEVWSVPAQRFGSFVAEVPAPLGIGNVVLDSGEVVKGFICEPYARSGATEITALGGWRAYLKQL